MSEIVPSRPALPEPAAPAGPPLLRATPGYEPERGGGEGVPLREYLAALRRYAWLVAAAVVASVGFAAYKIQSELPQYAASASLRLVNARQEMAGDMGTQATAELPGWYTDPILSQIQLLRSRQVAAEVVDSLGLRLRPERPDFPYARVAEARVSPGAPAGDTLHLAFGAEGVRGRIGGVAAEARYGEPLDLGGVAITFTGRPRGPDGARMVLVDEQAAVMQVLGSLSAAQRQMTNLIDVQYVAHDPHLAQRVANAAATTFQRVNQRSAQTTSRRRRIFVEEQLRGTDSMLVIAQTQLAAFRRGVQAFSPREKFRTTEEGLANFRIQRQALTIEKNVYDQMHAALTAARGREASEQLAALAASPEVASNGGMVSLYQQLIRYQTARDSLTTGRWARAGTNPDVQQLDSLVATFRSRLVRAVEARSEALAGQIAVLDDVMAEDAASIAGMPDAEAEETRLAREVETLQKLVDDLRRERQGARIDEAVEAGQVEVVDMALAPGGPVGNGSRRRLFFALLVGLMIGGGGALVLDRLNTSVVRREEAETALGTPVIAVIPRLGDAAPDRKALPRRFLPRRALGATEALVTVNDLHSAGSQAYRKLRTHLLFAQQAGALRTLMVTSPGASEGKTTVSANLAAAFAQQGLRVALVDADLRRARMHGVFGIARTPGLTEVLLGEAPVHEALRPTSVEGLHVLAAGRLVPSVSELLGGAGMSRLLRELAARHDLVMVDTPPVLAAADAEILGAQTDAALLVVRAGQTERQSAAYAAQQLRAIGARILGAVLNDPDAKIHGDGRYAYYYDYYTEEAGKGGE